jgi:hypothetical protein
VVVVVVKAVDVGESTVPACPLTIICPTLSELSHTSYHIGCIEAVTEVKVLRLNHILPALMPPDKYSCSLTGVREQSSSILHSTYATLVVSIRSLLMGQAPGCW